MSRFNLALAAAALISAPSLAADPPASAAKPVKPDKPVCRSIVNTGSYFRKRVCISREAWDKIAEQTGDATDQMMERKGNSRGGGSDGGF